MQCTTLRRYCRQAHLARWDDSTFAAFTTSGVNCAEQRGLTHNAALEQRQVSCLSHEQLFSLSKVAGYVSDAIAASWGSSQMPPLLHLKPPPLPKVCRFTSGLQRLPQVPGTFLEESWLPACRLTCCATFLDA